MSQGEDNESTNTSYDEAMEALSSLIFERNRADMSIKGIRLDLLLNYLEMLDLKEAIRELKIIHVAGTKGKGSTCTFTESILHNYGFRTGLFTSPHLIDVRERFRLDGMDISEEKFLAYFWWCWDRLKEKTTDEVPMPTWFRFLVLLAFKIFAAEQVDVVILEVGLGGKYDDTNVVETPIVCGISSLGYDHMEILGNTLGQIAGEKAGIFKRGVPAFTVPQPDEAMLVLEEKALQLDIDLQVAYPLDHKLLNGLDLGLRGEHQYQNAGLAIALCSTWLKRTNHVEINYLDQNTLPEQFIKGLTTARLQGRGQIVPDDVIESESPGDLMFYLDGAHTPESMDVCANWFCNAIKEGYEQKRFPNNQEHQESKALHESVGMDHRATSEKKSEQILLFNCMPVRNPQLLLPCLMSTCASHGVYFRKALFVPNMSVSNKVGSTAVPFNDTPVDLSWQLTLQRVWESLVCGEKGRDAKIEDVSSDLENSNVFPSLPLAINWLRDHVRKNQSTRFQVLVTGSLRLVGDMLKFIQK